MSKEMKMSDVSCDVTFVDYVANAVKNHDRLVDENAAMREMLISAGKEMQAVIGRLNQYESKDFRYDQLDTPELTDMQTVSEIKGLLSKGEGCV